MDKMVESLTFGLLGLGDVDAAIEMYNKTNAKTNETLEKTIDYTRLVTEARAKLTKKTEDATKIQKDYNAQLDAY